MRRVWILAALMAASCAANWNGLAPEAPSLPAKRGAAKLYGRPLDLVHEARQIPTASGSIEAVAEVLRADAIPGVAQLEANDCGPAAIATLLGFYHLKPQEDPDPLRAVKAAMPPKQWGTRLEEACAYLNRTGFLQATVYRDGELSGVLALVRDGRPVPVVVTLEGNLTRMHWMLIVGEAMTRAGDRYVLCKNPSDTDPLALSAYPEATFREIWENSPLRSQWWSTLMEGVTDTNVESYRRPFLDVGALAPP